MAVNKVRVNESHQRLMHAIGEAVRLHTAHDHMPVEGIIGVLGFTLGSAIARGAKDRNSRRQLREMAMANVDFGLEAMVSSMANTSLILPEGVQ